MNNEMKCPFCQQELEEETFSRGRVFVSCNNPNCIISDWGGCSKQIITELIHTRKALDILLFTINRLENQNYKDCAWHLRLAIAKIKAIGIANKALEQITALKQKDVK